MEPARYDSGAGYYRFKSYDERTVCELNPAESTLACERRLGGQLTDGNGAVGRTFSAPAVSYTHLAGRLRLQVPG